VSLEDGAREFLAREGFDPAYGARPLKRAIQRNIQDALATSLLEGRFHEGETVVFTAGKGGLSMTGHPAAA
jgi:ATP-dependent Clp protease ATP-binding subunit ClpA